MKVEAAFLAESGVSTRQFRLYDGSGLSHGNKLTAAAVARLLRVMSRRADAGVYHDSLSIAGRDGTLARRMRGTAAAGNVYAKTGHADRGELPVRLRHRRQRQAPDLLDPHGPRGPQHRRRPRAQDAIAVRLARARP